MKMTFNETETAIKNILEADKADATLVLNTLLQNIEKNVGQFYDGVIEHGPKMGITDEQWFDFHNKINHWRLRQDKRLMDKLSARHREILGIE